VQQVQGHNIDVQGLWQRLQGWARELGFSQIACAPADVRSAEPGLAAWLDNGWQGEMAYMARHRDKRAHPAALVPGMLSVITARMDYLPALPQGWQAVEWDRLRDAGRATVSVYARGRDYHKVLRQRLQALADRLAAEVGPFGHRVFTDSAPLLEVELATRSGLGWRGKHTLALNRDGGSMFFLGELCVDLALPATPPVAEHCGTCSACIDICPTQAIVAPYRLDARRCISYLTIEHAGPIPLELRPLIGNRIYGCDDCQLVCPWNKYAHKSTLKDFDRRAAFDDPDLLALWAWSEAEFLHHTEGSAIRRIGHERWQRNLAVALGNAWRESGDVRYAQALAAQRDTATPLVAEHIDWALAQRVQLSGTIVPASGAVRAAD
jgi:epoxyqueuosine reductase